MVLEQVQNKDVYMFDEPSSYLDVKQRLAAARMIRSLSKHDNYIIGSSLRIYSCPELGSFRMFSDWSH